MYFVIHAIECNLGPLWIENPLVDSNFLALICVAEISCLKHFVRIWAIECFLAKSTFCTKILRNYIDYWTPLTEKAILGCQLGM